MISSLEIEDDFDLVKLGFHDVGQSGLRITTPHEVSNGGYGPYASADWDPVEVDGLDESNPLSVSISTDSSETTLVPSVRVKDFGMQSSNVEIETNVKPDVDQYDAPSDDARVMSGLSAKVLHVHREPIARLVPVKRRNGGYRIGIKLNRGRVKSPVVEVADKVSDEVLKDPSKAPLIPTPTTPSLQSTLSDSFSAHILAQVISAIQTDPSGSQLPIPIRDFSSLISESSSVLRIANSLRQKFDLPLLSNNTSKALLRKSIATTRQRLLLEIVSGLILPTAPTPFPPVTENTTDTDGEPEKSLTLTPTNLRILASTLPYSFPSEKSAIKSFLSIPAGPAYGARGKVVWDGGVGRMIKNEGKGGFRGERDFTGDLHIFVDYSNILFGLLSHLSTLTTSTPSLSSSLPPRHRRVLSLPALSLLLRRGRNTPPGSLHLLASSPLSQPLDPLVRLGWEVSILKRVEMYESEVVDSSAIKLVTKPQTQIRENDGTKRYKEQGVDEILHLKILQTINAAPGKGRTMVLATGDARGGQFNPDGFVGAVREALQRGWKVELWSFKSGLSRAWSDIARREGWISRGRFTIWAMDDWAEQLVEVAEDLPMVN